MRITIAQTNAFVNSLQGSKRCTIIDVQPVLKDLRAKITITDNRRLILVETYEQVFAILRGEDKKWLK